MKIALLTPYTGYNLGDAAIQEAAVAQVRERYPDAELSLVALAPTATTGLPDITFFPLTPVEIHYYAPAPEEAPAGTAWQFAKGAAARLGPVERLARGTVHAVRALLRPVRRVEREVAHVVAAHRHIRGADMLIVSGGGQIDDYWGGPWGQPYALLKWGLLARFVGAEFVFLSVGTCSLASRLSVRFAHGALRLAGFRSYRDAMSRDLVGLPRLTRDDSVAPDLAFSTNRGTGPGTPPSGTVGISPIAYLSGYGWPQQDPSVFHRYFESLVEFTAGLTRRGQRVVLFTTDRPDGRVVQDIEARFREDESLAGVPAPEIAHTETLDALYEVLRDLTFVVASRLHGVILAHTAGLPVLALSYDRKVDTYMEDAGLRKYCLDIHRADARALADGFEEMRRNRDEIVARVRAATARHAATLARQYDRVLGTEKA